ncbi:TIGR00282 family metallophosphoesterase [Methylobacterium sp. 17Sr1-1]|uniref:TIGR00282 family metallophosphoesterase n=1 Tax=Methylobacterium sp. 17Sr1-1 TaxID=2202826 RepID=UPI000D6EBE43|nr:TIGR00282 family metallophosphoesterase [Methylobacterium sp. 17Sr1-1]AWN53434.1 TIGR00282 family metallophosphoesterase [Methylobacterium sp. 17Sr1-1]
MRLLFLGDVVGRPGRLAVSERLPALRERWRLDCVVINGENAAGGFGITESICDELINAGADAVTLGNHSFDQREAMVFIARQPRLVRPANYPPGTPGRGATVVETRSGARILVVNVMGRIFLDPLDDPFAAAERELSACPLRDAADAVVVDVHAEATSEKEAFGWFLDGRASLVVGTHTHVPTADHRILPGGTAYMSDVGMCGDYDSVLGMQKDEPVRRFLQKTPGSRLEAATGEGTLCGLAVETDDATGLARRVSPVRLGPHLEETWPQHWD